MKKNKLTVLFLTATVALLLAACSDGMGQGEFANITISLGNSKASKQLVELDGNKPLENHTYQLKIDNGKFADYTPGTTFRVATGSHRFEIRAYMAHDDFFSKFNLNQPNMPIPNGAFTSSKILRAIGVSAPVTISANQTKEVPINLYSAMEVSNWAELKWAAEGEPDQDDDINRKEIIILKQTTAENTFIADVTINIYRPIEIRAEGNVIIKRAPADTSDSGFIAHFFQVNDIGKLAIGATLEGESIGSSITLDGEIDSDENIAALIVASNDCTIGEKATLQNNVNYSTALSSGAPGGGVCIYGGTFTLFGQIKNNSAEENGGGVYIEGGSFVMEDGAVIAGNTAKSGSGGGVYITSSSNGSTTFTMNGGTIGGESAPNIASIGGGVFIQQGAGTGTVIFQMAGGYISYNQALFFTGGGVNMTGGTFTMTGGRITGNGCGGNGGGVYVAGGTFEIDSPAKSGDVPDGSVTNNENNNVRKGNGGMLSGTGLATGDNNGW